MIDFAFTVISCTARYPKSISFSGWPSANAAVFPTWPVSVPAVAYPATTALASAAYGTLPFHPPLPTAWNFPFQPEEGSHTSTLMSESLDGVSVAVTRQNAGSLANTVAGPPGAGAPGGVNVPGATCCAVVIFALGRLSVAIDSQVAADADGTKLTKVAKHTKIVNLVMVSTFFIVFVPFAIFVDVVLFTNEVGGLVDAAAALVARDLRIRAQRTRAIHFPVP